MRPKVKAMAYMKRMITSSKWTQSVPSSAKISNVIGVSPATIRAALKVLENQRFIENNGSLGYFVIPRKFEELYKTNKQLYYIALLQKSIRISQLLDKGGKIKGNFIVLRTGDIISVGDIASGNIINTTIDELKSLIADRITVESLLKLKGKKLKQARELYLRQNKIITAQEFLLKNRKELGI